jgi:hypothetical protein
MPPDPWGSVRHTLQIFVLIDTRGVSCELPKGLAKDKHLCIAQYYFDICLAEKGLYHRDFLED